MGVKHHGPSTLAIDSAKAAGIEELRDWDHATVHTTASAQSPAWKEQIASQLPPQPENDRPLELQLCSRLDPRD